MVRKRTKKKTEDAKEYQTDQEIPDLEIDGIKLKFDMPDLDGDGETGGIERISSGYNGVTPIIQPSEMGEILKAMNEDAVDDKTNMRSIDLKTRINWLERNSIAALDTVSHMHVCRPTILTHVIKRLNVSIGGKGREENLKAIVGEREHRKESQGLFSGLKDKFMGGK